MLWKMRERILSSSGKLIIFYPHRSVNSTLVLMLPGIEETDSIPKRQKPGQARLSKTFPMHKH